MLEICRSVVFYLNCDVVGEFLDETFLRLCGRYRGEDKHRYHDDMENIHRDEQLILAQLLMILIQFEIIL